MSDSYIAGYFFGVTVALLIALAAFLVFKARHKNSNKYDERQVLARGVAFKYAFFTQLGYFCVMMIIDQVITPWADRSMEMFIGLVISVFVYAAICIKKDAYISFQEKPQVYIIMFSAIGGINALIVLGNLATGSSFIKDGLVTFRAANLICAVLMLALAAVLLIKSHKDASGDHEENSDLREKE